MGIIFETAISVICDTSTVGGATYYVDGEPKCFRLKTGIHSDNDHCGYPAGMGTDHPGTGCCHMHNPKYYSRRMKHGRYSDVSKRKQKILYEEYVNDPDMLNLVPELALLRSILADVHHSQYDVTKPRTVTQVANLIMQVTQVVERIEKIQSSQILTVAVARLIMVKAIEVAKQYIPEEQHREFIQDWKTDVLGDLEMTSNNTSSLIIEGK